MFCITPESINTAHRLYVIVWFVETVMVNDETQITNIPSDQL